jgi:D-amino-acid dehydrogenase
LAGLLARLPNVTLALGTDVRRLVRDKQRIKALQTADGELQADAFVVAAGMHSINLLKPLGVALPLYGLRGYSLSVPLPEGDRGPALSITDAGRKVVYAPLGRQLRIAAMVDMGVDRAEVDPARIDLLKQQVAEIFPALALDDARAWAGLRPSTASSKPIIDRAGPFENLWLNVGQGALGFTLALGSGQSLAQRIAGVAPAIDLAPFKLA